MFTYLALLISYVYNSLAILYYLLHLSRSVTAHPYILYFYILVPFLYWIVWNLLDIRFCCGVVRYYPLDTAVLSHLEA